MQKQIFKTKLRTLLIALVFGIVGCVLVISSFAQSRVDTTNPGTVEIQSIRIDGATNEYEFSVANKLTYCFIDKGIPSGGAALKIMKPRDLQDKITRVAEDTVKGELYCFRVDKAYSNVRMQLIAKDVNSVVSLSIR